MRWRLRWRQKWIPRAGRAGQAGRPGASAVSRAGPQERSRLCGLGGGRRPQRLPAAAGRRGGPGGGAALVDQAPPEPGRRPHPDHQPAPPAADGPGPRRRPPQPHRQARRRAASPQSDLPASRRSPAGSWPASSWPTCSTWTSKSPRWRRRSRPWSPQADTSLAELFGVGPVLAATFLAGSVTSVGSRASTFRRSYRHRPVGGLQRPGHPPPAVTGRGPQAQSRLVHDGHGPGPPGQHRAGLLPARRQVGQGGVAVLEAPAVGRRLPLPAGRSGLPRRSRRLQIDPDRSSG